MSLFVPPKTAIAHPSPNNTRRSGRTHTPHNNVQAATAVAEPHVNQAYTPGCPDMPMPSV
eukprot:6067987-Prymnesium_polylepis.1